RRIWNPNRTGVGELRLETELPGLFQERTGVFVEKPPLILININELPLALGNAEHLVNENVRAVVLLHRNHALVNAALQLGSVTVGQRSYFVFHRFGVVSMNSDVTCPRLSKGLLRVLSMALRY